VLTPSTEPITVIKVGGNELEDRSWLAALAAGLAAVRERVVVVHGGGREVSALQGRLGLEPVWHEGLRVTTPETMPVVSMVLSGLVNKRIAAVLQDAGLDAVGLSGEDGVLLAEPSHGGALGRVGAVAEVRTRVLSTLLEAGIVPVLSPVSRGPDGAALNVNADDAAVAIAAALGASRLLYVSDVAGVASDGRVLDAIAADGVEALIAAGVATGGMAPKLRAAARAVAAGIGEVRIGAAAILHGGAGTRVLDAAGAGAADASIAEVAA